MLKVSTVSLGHFSGLDSHSGAERHMSVNWSALQPLLPM